MISRNLPAAQYGAEISRQGAKSKGEVAGPDAPSSVRESKGAYRLRRGARSCRAFAKRLRLAQRAQPGQYVLVEVQTSRKLTKALLFPRAILRAEAEADRPFREAMAIKRERLAAKRAAKDK
jgi:hypothetical protein